MINAFYTGIAGAQAYQTMLDITANNIANTNTAGYKAQQAVFLDLLYNSKDGATEPLAIGSGVKIGDIVPDMAGGAIEFTGNPYDFAILGDGYFAVQDAAGETAYTRVGNFRLSEDETNYYLVTADGDAVLDTQMQPITISKEEQPNFLFAGPAAADMETADDEAIIRLAICRFANPSGLLMEGMGKVSATEASGAGIINDKGAVIQGALESSNVDLSTEMVNLIQAQRGFQLASKVIQTADELENIANTLR